MPQAGLHAMVGAASRKWFPRREWLLLGVVLGNLFPDLDNLAVAIATLTKSSTEGLHRTFTHSLFTAVAVVILFYFVAGVTRKATWNSFGLGLGAGILMHILLDLVLWFNGVKLLWPIRYELNFWSWFSMPAWLENLLNTGEFLAFGLFFWLLVSIAAKNGTDQEYQSKARLWAYLMFGLFVIFTVMAFTMSSGWFTIYGGLYLLSLIIAVGVTIRMRSTIEKV